MNDLPSKRGGQLSVTVLFFAALSLVLMTGFVFLSSTFLQLSVRSFNRNQTFEIAESGVEYYRWHLAHDATDYYDGHGATSTGPYAHPYYDKDGNRIGEYDLTITPPPTGSTVVTVQSTGKIDADSSIKKIIKVKFAIPSFAKYAVAANDNMRFGAGTEVFGELLSNQGIHFDGLAHNLIGSALTTYNDPDYSDGPEYAVYTRVSPQDPNPPTALPTRTDVFAAGRELALPALDFSGITQDLATIKSNAQSAGYYATSSGAFGYDLVFSTTTASTTYTIYKVTALTAVPNKCTNSAAQDGWGTWSVSSESFVASGTIPSNGTFFIEDNAWVRGQIKNTRVTIASGKFPDNAPTRTSITVNSNLLYTNYDGTDVIALIAQNNLNVGMVSADTLRIDGALIAENGRVGRYYYGSKCTDYTRTSLTSYGMIGSAVRYGFAYTDGTGYDTRTLVYDSNLLYGPPPSFPLTTDEYTQVSWDEVQ